MNIFRILYSRCQQQVLHATIPFLPYRNPQILNSTTEIAACLKRSGHFSALIVTGPHVHASGLLEPMKEELNKEGIAFYVFDKTVANPSISNIEEAVLQYKENGCDCIIGFGGGSPLDCAKIVAARIARPDMSVKEMKGVFKIGKKTPLLVAIPTTAGTGSEVTATAVITDTETHFKFTINDLHIIPSVAVLDPTVTKALPPKTTSTTGMDALTHAVEAYIGRSTVRATRKDALDAVQLISENLLKAYLDGENIEARRNMLMGSFLAGRSFAKSYVGYCHAVAHSLGGAYNIPHGLANAVLLPCILKGYGSSIYRKCKKLAIAAGVACEKDSCEEATQKFISFIEELNRKMSIPQTIDALKEEDIPMLAATADKEANPFYPVPKMFDKNELKRFYIAVITKGDE